MVKSVPAMLESRVRSLGWEDPLTKEMASHSSVLVWKIPWTEKPGGLQSMGSQRLRHDYHFHSSIRKKYCRTLFFFFMVNVNVTCI